MATQCTRVSTWPNPRRSGRKAGAAISGGPRKHHPSRHRHGSGHRADQKSPLSLCLLVHQRRMVAPWCSKPTGVNPPYYCQPMIVTSSIARKSGDTNNGYAFWEWQGSGTARFTSHFRLPDRDATTLVGGPPSPAVANCSRGGKQRAPMSRQLLVQQARSTRRPVHDGVGQAVRVDQMQQVGLHLLSTLTGRAASAVFGHTDDRKDITLQGACCKAALQHGAQHALA